MKLVDWFKEHIIIVLLLIAAGLLAYAVSLPLLVSTVEVVSLDPNIILGLTSFVVAILALVGGIVFFTLKSILQEQVHIAQEQVRNELRPPLEVERWLSYSLMCYFHYSTIWAACNFNKNMDDNIYFLHMLDYSKRTAESAFRRAKPLATLPGSQEYLNAVNSLSYQLATACMVFKDEEDGQEAIRLVGELLP